MDFWRDLFARPVGAVPTPSDNPQSLDKIALGRTLFNDLRLSGHGTRSCASCHQPAHGFTDGRSRAVGLAGEPLKRNVPMLYNLAWAKSYFWDGRKASLEAQARVPIEHPREMNGTFAKIIVRLQHDKKIVAQFRAAFAIRAVAAGRVAKQEQGGKAGGKLVTAHNIGQAIAAFERTLISPLTRFDEWLAGETEALTATEFAGFRLFVGKAGCVGCHVGWRFTDDRFHNIGIGDDDPGRGAVAGGVPGLAAFKTPGLRQLAHTAPYMHGGSLPDLAAVIDHYNGGFKRQRNLSSNMIRDLALSDLEKSQLIAFLHTLSSK